MKASEIKRETYRTVRGNFVMVTKVHGDSITFKMGRVVRTVSSTQFLQMIDTNK